MRKRKQLKPRAPANLYRKNQRKIKIYFKRIFLNEIYQVCIYRMDRQDDEIDALESIFENFHFDVAKRVGIISVEPELPENGVEISDSENSVKSRVHYLPPIKLKFKMPQDYPEKSAPLVTLSSCWLSILQLVWVTQNFILILKKCFLRKISFYWINY